MIPKDQEKLDDKGERERVSRRLRHSWKWCWCRREQKEFRACVERWGEDLMSISIVEQPTNKGMMSDSWRHEWVGRMNSKLLSGLKLT